MNRQALISKATGPSDGLQQKQSSPELLKESSSVWSSSSWCYTQGKREIQSKKIKAFFFNDWIAVLPAFGSLTGQHSLGEAGHYFGIFENQIKSLGNWSE